MIVEFSTRAPDSDLSEFRHSLMFAVVALLWLGVPITYSFYKNLRNFSPQRDLKESQTATVDTQ